MTQRPAELDATIVSQCSTLFAMRMATDLDQALHIERAGDGYRVFYAIADLPAVTGHVRAGRLRMLAVTSAQRIPMLPGVPTVAESGLPGYDVAIWYGLLAPDTLPRPVRDRLQGAIAAIFKAPDKALLDQFTALGIVATPLNTPEQFADFIKTDFAFWKKLVTDAGVKPN